MYKQVNSIHMYRYAKIKLMMVTDVIESNQAAGRTCPTMLSFRTEKNAYIKENQKSVTLIVSHVELDVQNTWCGYLLKCETKTTYSCDIRSCQANFQIKSISTQLNPAAFYDLFITTLKVLDLFPKLFVRHVRSTIGGY